MFEGLTVALVTPFRNGAIDGEAVDRLVEHCVEGGADGLVPSGSTGESPVLTAEERRELFRRVKRASRGRAFLLAGTGTNSTASTVAQTRVAAEEGADGALVVTPYYNKPTPAGLIGHYRQVADEGGLPVCLYNVPGRTGINLLPSTVAELSGHERITAIKEASGSLDQVTEICAQSRLTVLSGDDSLTLPILAVGGAGVISVLGNLVPGPMKRLLAAFGAGDLAGAIEIHHRLYPLARAMFIESNPGPIKYALARVGLIAHELRPPLAPVTAGSAARIDAALAALPDGWLARRPS